MDLREGAAIFGAGVGAGMINAVAGGGTLLSFPVLVWLGRDPIVANATNALALWPGALAGAVGFRHELARVPRLLSVLLPSAVVGAVLGAWLLMHTSSATFAFLVPYLVLVATLLLAFQRPLQRLLTTPSDPAAPSDALRAGAVGLALGQLVVSIYGGYFGAGMGILMLAALALYGLRDIHERNALKNVAAAVTNGVAGLYFAASHAIAWPDALILTLGAILGGYAGARLSRRLPRPLVETLVVALGLTMTAALFVR